MQVIPFTLILWSLSPRIIVFLLNKLPYMYVSHLNTKKGIKNATKMVAQNSKKIFVFSEDFIEKRLCIEPIIFKFKDNYRS